MSIVGICRRCLVLSVAGLVRSRSFACGVLVGALVPLGFGVGMVGALVFQGVRLRVDAAAISVLVEARVEHAARGRLPAIVQRLSRDAPKALVGRLSSSGGISIFMFDVEMRLPDAVAKQVDRQLETRLTTVLASAIRAYDTEPLVSMVGDSARDLVYESLNDEFSGKRFPVRVFPWLTVPVSVEVN